MHIVFVCTGNICRSAFAERYANAVASANGLTQEDLRFSSVGVGAVIGAPMDVHMAAELQVRGGDARGFVARQLDYESIRDADLLLPMEMQHRNALIEEYPELHRKSVVLKTAARAMHELKQTSFTTLQERLTRLVSAPPRPVRGDGVKDPYGRGQRAAAIAAAEISAALDELLS